MDVELAEILERALASLAYRQRVIIELRFGINGHDQYTFEEVGRIFKITRERVRRLEKKALIKLRKNKNICDWLESQRTEKCESS